MAEEVFYVALKTGEIVVYNTRLNPCIPCESWVPSNNQQEVTCIDMVRKQRDLHCVYMYCYWNSVSDWAVGKTRS